MKCDVLIVGAGFAGLVMAERLTAAGKSCIVIEKRNHIGGNAFDYYNEVGVLAHKYGPHLFHTKSQVIFDYLSQFTDWIPATYKTVSHVRGKVWDIPINLNTFEQLIGVKHRNSADMAAYLEKVRVDIPNPRNAEEAVISKVGWELYEMFYKAYTIKQWGRHPRELEPSVTARIPIRTNRNDLYFDDPWQCMPKEGYTAMFHRMIADKFPVLLNTSFPFGCERTHTVYTGPLDGYFDFKLGRLPYRSLQFKNTNHICHLKQSVVSEVYPDAPFTRRTEVKHVTGQVCPNTTTCEEYPEEHDESNEPYYPIPSGESRGLNAAYKELAAKERNVTFTGRLATYKYLDMNQVIGSALLEARRLIA